MNYQVNKANPLEGNLGNRILQFKKKKVLGFIMSLVMIGVPIWLVSVLLSGGGLAWGSYSGSSSLPIPTPVAWILVLLFFAVGIYMLHRTFFAKLEITFFNNGVVTAKGTFFYSQLADVFGPVAEMLCRLPLLTRMEITGVKWTGSRKKMLNL